MLKSKTFILTHQNRSLPLCLFAFLPAEMRNLERSMSEMSLEGKRLFDIL